MFIINANCKLELSNIQAEYTNNKNVYMNCIQGARDKIEQVDFFIRD